MQGKVHEEERQTTHRTNEQTSNSLFHGSIVGIRRLRSFMDAAELVELDTLKNESTVKSFALVAARSLCDEDGNLFFPNEETAVPMLMEKDLAVLQLIATKVAELNSSHSESKMQEA